MLIVMPVCVWCHNDFGEDDGIQECQTCEKMTCLGCSDGCFYMGGDCENLVCKDHSKTCNVCHNGFCNSHDDHEANCDGHGNLKED